MGRPRNPDKERVNTTIKLPAELLDRITAEAKKRTIGRVLLFERLLEIGLQHLRPIDIEEV